MQNVDIVSKVTPSARCLSKYEMEEGNYHSQNEKKIVDYVMQRRGSMICFKLTHAME